MYTHLLSALLAVAPVAHAGDAEDVRAFFDDLVARHHAFDPGVADLYAPDAKVITLRDGTDRLEMNGAQWSALLRQFMAAAKGRGDVSTYANVAVAAHGDGFRVTATRTAAAKCAEDPAYHLDVAKHDGAWRIVEEYTTTVSLPRCPPSPKLAAAMKALRDGVRPHLPLALDADTRLETVEIEGSALIYGLRLHTIAVNDPELATLPDVLHRSGLENICGTPSIRSLVDAGATVRYAYTDRDGARVVNVDVPTGTCP